MMYENWAKLEEVCRYFPFNPVMDIEIYKEKVHKWANNYESNTYFHWVIEWKENHELIGTIKYAFEEIELNRVQAEVFDGNIASAHVLVKCGMQFEGIARQKYYKNGRFIDTAQCAVLKCDFKE